MRRAFAPGSDDAVHVHQEDGVVAHVLDDEGVQEIRVQPGELRRAHRLVPSAVERSAALERGLPLV
jgi:hypothetical protein